MKRTRRVRLVLLAVLLGVASLGAYADDIARGDSAWASRAEGERDGRPQSGRVLEAVAHFESALVARPESLEARWKLLRALHFAGDFALLDEVEGEPLFERARDVSEEGLELLAQQLGSGTRLDELESDAIASRLETSDVRPEDAARLHFWAAINWGAWSRTVGLLSAVRQGVANRLHRYALVTIALEPDYEEGGAFRLLGSLHAELPSVPFLSGWVDRREAIPLLERAYALAPGHPGNGLLLSLTLFELAPERSGEALRLLGEVGRLEPRPSMRIEDLAILREAQQELAGREQT